ncbi:MAG: copper chaperone PCu(A)C [Magnetococcales bacterium]|nr:copper chaperone PCu(A)C [Magnetococcales bacterium]MBF0632275.1 copper chaperone PCu(A)C [Magnetococcales bacterium]
MKKISIVSLLLGLFFSLHAWAGAGINVVDPWVRAAPPTVQSMAAYMAIENSGSAPMTLVEVRSPSFLKIELHQTTMVNGLAGMVPQKNMVIDPGARVELKPGSYHLMLLTPQTPIREGGRVPLTLVFGDGSRVEVEAVVRKDAQGQDSSGHPAGHAPGHDMH